jgi:LuxR family transcriptional regulator of csgAB operon
VEYHTINNKNNKNLIIFLSQHNIHTRLMQRELIKSGKLIIKHREIHELAYDEDINNISIILIDYLSINQEAYRNILQSDTLKFDLIIYNFPVAASSEELILCSRLKGILFDNAPIEHLTSCVESVIKGGMWLPRDMMAKMINNLRAYIPTNRGYIKELTKREKQILDRMVCGQSNLQIANDLCVAESTVKTHIYKMYKKMNVKCRREAIQFVKSTSSPSTL